jgi:hypothetical protein
LEKIRGKVYAMNINIFNYLINLLIRIGGTDDSQRQGCKAFGGAG